MALDIQQFTHLGVAVSDMDRSLAFYVDLLGFEKHYDRDFEDPRRPGLKMRLSGVRAPGGNTAFELIETGGPGRDVDVSGCPVIAFSVPDIEAANQQLVDAGCTITMPPKEMAPGIVMNFFEDPDGRTLECVEFSLGETNLITNYYAEAEAAAGTNSQ